VNDVKILTGHSVSLSNSSPGAALLIQDKDNVVWALTWGTGFHFLDSEQIDFGFGSRIVARSALPAEVKSLTKTVLDHRARVDRSSMPNGSTIRDLGVDGYGEVVSRIEAKAVIEDLAVGNKVIQLRASDSLNVPLAKSAEHLIRDLGSSRHCPNSPCSVVSRVSSSSSRSSPRTARCLHSTRSWSMRPQGVRVLRARSCPGELDTKLSRPSGRMELRLLGINGP
jgi:hypothetical protein